jgi:hypothetical protein
MSRAFRPRAQIDAHQLPGVNAARKPTARRTGNNDRQMAGPNARLTLECIARASGLAGDPPYALLTRVLSDSGSLKIILR